VAVSEDGADLADVRSRISFHLATRLLVFWVEADKNNGVGNGDGHGRRWNEENGAN